MASTLCLVCLLLAAARVDGRTRLTLHQPAGKPRRTLRGVTPSVQATSSDVSDTGSYIVVFKQNAGTTYSASQRLVRQVAAVTTKASTASSKDADTAQPPFQLYTLDGSPISNRISSATVEEVSAASAPPEPQGIQSIVVKGANPAVLSAIKAADNVAHVIPNLPVKSAAACTDARSLSQGIASSLAVATTVWSGPKRCVDSNTKLLWMGDRCGDDFDAIQYKAIYAVNAATGAIKQQAGKPCVLLPRDSNANYNMQRFGDCGAAPSMAADLPTRLCPAGTPSDNCITPKLAPSTAGGSSSSLTYKLDMKNPVQCGSRKTRRLTYTGIPCGPDGQYVAWVSASGPGNCQISVGSDFKSLRDVFGSCGVPPGGASQAVAMSICDGGSNPGDSTSSPTPESSPSPSPVTTPSPSPSPEPVDDVASLKKAAVLPGQTVPTGLQIIGAATAAGIADPTSIPAGNRLLVGVLDCGVDSNHPDINYAGGKNFMDVDANPGQDNYGHGTHIAGIVAAKNNGLGVVGVSPGTGVYSLKVLDDLGNGVLSSTLAAVKWVATDGAKLGIKVLNLSLTTFLNPANSNYAGLKEVVCEYYREASNAGVVITAAAGNDGKTMEGYFPAVCPHVIAVTAVDATGKSAASYSNWVATSDTDTMAHSVAAPGTAIYSTVPTVVDSSGYYTLTGTSMAAPHVAGVAANCLMSGACKATSTGFESMSVILSAAQSRPRLESSAARYSAQDTVASGKWYGPLLYAKF